MFPFNVRVYGLLIESDRVLVLNEVIKGMAMTKFPGGGLEFKEGTKDCLIREFQEELNLDIEIDNHYYTTDFYQESAFNKNHQILSVYYLVKRKSISSLPVINTSVIKGFSWISLKDLKPESFTFPIDRYIVNKLINTNA